MKEIHSNINIIGGGLIGACVGYALSLLDYKITIIEKNKVYSSFKNQDYRTIAISEGTKIFLEKIHIWQEIKQFAQPIKKIKVIDRKQANKLEFDNIRRNSNLGYIVKNKHVLDIFYKNLINKKNIKIINSQSPISFEIKENKIITKLEKCFVKSNLNIASDGKYSRVKQLLKTPNFEKNYHKSAMVLTLTHSRNHDCTAFEFFYKNGPLAILPMQSKKKNIFASSIVWTNKDEYLLDLFKMEDFNLKNILENETQGLIGNIKNILSKQIFPLNAHLNTVFYEDRTIYVGDAAHSFHPIAGQGWNLGMKDIENLYELVKKYHSLGIELGDNFFCKDYHNDNYFNAYKLYQLTDKLDNIFKIDNLPFSFARSMGLKLIQKNKKINNLISDIAMGIN